MAVQGSDLAVLFLDAGTKSGCLGSVPLLGVAEMSSEARDDRGFAGDSVLVGGFDAAAFLLAEGSDAGREVGVLVEELG